MKPYLTPQALRRAPEVKEARQVKLFTSCRLEVKAVGDEGVVEGYGSVFNTEDSYGDVITPGAFDASLKAHKAEGTMPAMLWQHNTDAPIGVWEEMTEDGNGLMVKGRLILESPRAAEAFALLKAKALNGLSIGFMAKQWTISRDTEIRTLTEIDLWEVSLVTFPANGKARVTQIKQMLEGEGLDDIQTLRDAEKFLRDVGFSRQEAKGFISKVSRLQEVERDARRAENETLAAAERLLNSLKS